MEFIPLSWGNIVSIHNLCFMPLILWCLCNTFFLTQIWNYNQGHMWSCDPWYQVHFGPSPWLNDSSIRHGECLQFLVKRSHILKTSCNRWGHHTTHPLRAFYIFESTMFYNHCNCESEVIPLTMGTHQGDPLGGALFVVAHFRALHSTTSCFPSCYFHLL